MSEPPHPAWRFSALVLGASGLGLLLGGALSSRDGALAGAALAALAAGGLLRRMRSREKVRATLLAAPFPARFRAILSHRCHTYLRLPAVERERFERGVRVFLLDKRITGVGVTVTEELRVLVAASAVTLSLGWDEYAWPKLTEVLLYPQDFSRDYSFGQSDLAGQAHPWGTVILSVPSLQESFTHPSDGFHVGFHEFAHLLDIEESRFDGLPPGLSADQGRRWTEVMEQERTRMAQGGVIDPYGQNDPVEFFAVAVEAFFECPQDLEREHEPLYSQLREFFRQHPAGQDRARFG